MLSVTPKVYKMPDPVPLTKRPHASTVHGVGKEMVEIPNRNYKMITFSLALVVLVAGVLVGASSDSSASHSQLVPRRDVPEQAQIIDWKSFNVLPTVLPPTVANASTVSHPLQIS